MVQVLPALPARLVLPVVQLPGQGVRAPLGRPELPAVLVRERARRRLLKRVLAGHSDYRRRGSRPRLKPAQHCKALFSWDGSPKLSFAGPRF